MTVKIINLTPHEVTVLTDSGRVFFPASGDFARLAETRSDAPALSTTAGEVPAESVSYHGLIDLPDPAPGVAYLVSRVVAAESDRRDLYFPSGEVRDPKGRIIGCEALGQFVHRNDA